MKPIAFIQIAKLIENSSKLPANTVERSLKKEKHTGSLTLKMESFSTHIVRRGIKMTLTISEQVDAHFNMVQEHFKAMLTDMKLRELLEDDMLSYNQYDITGYHGAFTFELLSIINRYGFKVSLNQNDPDIQSVIWSNDAARLIS